MKRIIFFILLVIVFVSGCTQSDENGNGEVFCPDYDGNEAECLLHEECEWSTERNECDSIDMDEDDDDNDYEGPIQELENINIPDNPSNTLCKQIPLSSEMPYSGRYYCLAVVNHNAEFCEGMDEENDKNICLAHAEKNSSYCEEIEGQDANHVCYYMLAVTSENVNFCEDIDYLDTSQENQHEREQCYFSFMSNLYQWGKSEEITTEMCSNLGSPDDQTCLALKSRDISMCGYNSHCLTFFEQPISFCEENDIDFVNCMKDRAKYSKNISICDLLPQPDRDSCVGVYCTHIELDVAICDTIIDLWEREDRYIELAINLANE